MITNFRSLATRSIVLAVFAVAGTASDASALEVLFDNLAQSANGYSGVGNANWMAQSFSTTEAGYVLDTVSIRLYNGSGTTGSYSIQVWDSTGTGNSPGAQVGASLYTGLAQNLSSNSSNLLTISGLSFTLTANRTYYVVTRGTNLTDIPDGDGGFFPGYLSWSNAAPVTTPRYSYNTGTGTWAGPYSYNSYMSVSAVPEPSTWALAGLSALTIGFSKRKRMRAVTAAA